MHILSGNSYGRSNNGTICKGCGRQEQFYSCADIAIGNDANGSQGNGYSRPDLAQYAIVESRPQLIPTFIDGATTTCRAVPAFRIINNLADNWCQSNCRQGYCPAQFCTPGCQKLTAAG